MVGIEIEWLHHARACRQVVHGVVLLVDAKGMAAGTVQGQLADINATVFGLVDESTVNGQH
jgi:hypothetical protein